MSKEPNEIGALWIADGKRYAFSGIINGQRVVVFQNSSKSGKQPDYRILKSTKPEPRPQRPTDDDTF